MAGRKTTLDRKKLKSLFAIMQIAPQNKYIAYQLGLSKVDTIRIWLNKGEVLISQFEEELEPLEDIFAFEYESVFENRKLEFDAEFRRQYSLEPEGDIPDRLRLEYKNFMKREKAKFIEAQVFRRETEILEDIQLVEDKEADQEFKLYIQFYRVYNRGRAVKEMGYLENIDMHASSSKNVGLSLKLIEKMNKEDFGETQNIQHTGTIDVNAKSILAMALSYEKQQKQLLEANDTNVIDVKEVKQIESKD